MRNLKGLFFKKISLILLILLVFVFFYPFFLFGKIPIPADTIVGMYHPFRDNLWNNLVSGVPVKNPLITDPVRQQYVWRYLSVDNLKRISMPLWNPYSFSGTPLFANFQSASLYPLNILFLFLPFNLAWTVLIILELFLAGLFLYLYLRYLKISKTGSLIGSFTFAFSGFSIAWLTWNTIIQTVMWLPLILLAKEKLLKEFTFKWVAILIFAESCQILAGHLQLLFYSLLISNLYLLVRIFQTTFNSDNLGKNFRRFLRVYIPFIMIGVFIFLITIPQWLSTLQFINLSARNFDQGSWTKAGWFIPWQNLIQFISPDFFGNPATGNYYGEWNYGEFIGYIGIIPLIFSFYALIFRQDKKTLFIGSLVFLSLLFSLPTPIAKLPYLIGIPLVATSQPTRLIFVTDFCLSILAALGFDKMINENRFKRILTIILPLALTFFILWIFIFNEGLFKLSLPEEFISVSKRNLIFPTVLFLGTSCLLLSRSIIHHKQIAKTLIYISLVIGVLDILRFGWKFTPFTPASWIFPQTKLMSMLKNGGNWRFMATDRRIMPPNFSVYYRLQDVSGYDPLYIKRYGELIAAWERGKPDISPASFNRILTPQDYSSPIADLLGVKYILSLTDEKSTKLKLVDREGDTRLYENNDVLPRTFLTNKVLKAVSDQDEINKIFSLKNKLEQYAVSQNDISVSAKPLEMEEFARIVSYQDNDVNIQVNAKYRRLLVFTDIYYPSWKAYLDGQKVEVKRVDYTLRGIIIPKGKHTVEFKDYLL